MNIVTPEEVGFASQRLARINAKMQRYVDEQKLAGISTLIARRGKVVHFEQVGMADCEASTPMRADTIFRIYSMTKPITSVAVLMLQFMPANTYPVGANPNVTTASVKGMTPLHLAVMYSAGDEDEIRVDVPQLLLIYGADLTLRDSVRQMTPLEWAERMYMCDEKGRTAVAKLLREYS